MFCVIETNSMFIHTRLNAPKMFAKFGCITQTLCKQKRGKNGQPSMGQTDVSILP